MTGEMIKSDVTREAYPLHFAIADELGGSVEPFDQYQGPYVVIGGDIRSGSGPYALAPRGLGIVRLWICCDERSNGALCFVYNEANDKSSAKFLWDDEGGAVLAARSVLRGKRRGRRAAS